MTGKTVLGGYAGAFPKQEWIFLPASWRGRKFQVAASVQNTKGGENHQAEWVSRIELDVLQYNYDNASFLIQGCWWSRTDIAEVFEKELEVRWIAIA